MTCHQCGRPMVPKRHKAPEGHVRHYGHGLCSRCYQRATYTPRPPKPRAPRATPRQDSVIDDVHTLRLRTNDPEVIAAALGISPAGVAEALRRAGRPDLARPFWQAQWRLRRTA